MNRKTRLLLLLILIPVGLSTKFYHGPFQIWVHGYAGDIFYPMFWYFLLRLLWEKSSVQYCAILIFLFCTAIEFSQLIKTPLLQTLRSTFPGELLLGSGFDWPDIFYYGLGVLLAVGIERGLQTREGQRQKI